MNERFERFTVMIAKINRNIRKIKIQEMAEYSLGSPHISCLYYLYSHNTVTATDLCEKCDEDKATISRSIEHLEKNGYLTCESKHIKRYKSPIVLTEKGKAVAKKIFDKVNAVLDEISEKMSENERIEFYRSLTVINEGLDAICKRFEKNKGTC